MGILDKLKPQPRWKHSDPAVRLSAIPELGDPIELATLAEQDQPMTAETLTELYTQLLKDYYGDAIDLNPYTGITWSRIPHFFNSPFYVYQYATCFASAAKLSKTLMDTDPEAREIARARYLSLLSSGGNDHPMTQLQKAGVDLTQPDTVAAVVRQLDKLVTQLEHV